MVRLPEYELFLAFPLAAARMDELRAISLGLEVNTATARMSGVDLYYRADTDVMLLGLRFDARTATHTLLQRVRDEADGVEAAVLEPARLPVEERSKFYKSYLGLYAFCLRDFPTVSDAVRALARDLGNITPGIEAIPYAQKRGKPSKLEVRYRRGDEWQLGRLRNLSREGIYILTGSAVRVGEDIEINVTSGQHALTVRASVIHVTREEVAASTGGAGFGARFLLGGPDERSRLEQIVNAGCTDGLGTIRPTPARREERYPIRWPVYLDTEGGCSNASALDVSIHGIFVGTMGKLPGESVQISMPIDDFGDPIRAKGRIARNISKDVAKQRGVATGYGLELNGFSLSDETRFRMFVARVHKRSELRVVVGASPDRAIELTQELQSAGYVATGISDPKDIMRKVKETPPDLLLMDTSLEKTQGKGVRTLRRVLAHRDVKMYFLEPHQPLNTVRSLADAALLS